jgi:hypothetical protein
MFAYSCLLTVYVVMCTSTVYNLYTVLRPVMGPCLLTRFYWPYALSCVRLQYVICTLCYVQWLDHVCLLVSTDRVCCHMYVYWLWSVHCVTSSNWTMFAYSCLLTVYASMCTSDVWNLYTVLRPVIGPCMLTRVYWPYMLSCVRLLYVISTLCDV